MTLEKQIRLSPVEIAARHQFVLVGISADRASEIPKELRLLLETFQLCGNERYEFLIDI